MLPGRPHRAGERPGGAQAPRQMAAAPPPGGAQDPAYRPAPPRPEYASRPAGVCVLHDGITVGTGPMNEAETEYAWLFATEFRPVARTVYLIVHDRGRAEDITQDAFVELLRRWHRISRYDRPGAWVRRIAIRMAIRDAGRERRRSAAEGEAPPPATTEPADIDLLRAVGSLPPM